MRYSAQILFLGIYMHSVNQQIGESLKALRKKQGWSLDRTAQETGVSKAMLGQIERGESSPTIATLWKIASGFQTSLSALLEPETTGFQGVQVRSAEQIRHQPAKDSMLLASLFPYDERFRFEWLELTLPIAYEHYSQPHLQGVIEHVVVLQGEIELFIEQEWRAFSKGDAVRFAADQPHGYRNVGNVEAAIHNLIYYPV